MGQGNEYSLYKRRYAQISIKKRMALVEMVLEKGKSLAQGSRKLNIKPSTAKLIVKKYQDTGCVFMKKLKNEAKTPSAPVPKVEIHLPTVKVEEEQLLLNPQQPQDKHVAPLIDSNYIWVYYPNYTNFGWNGAIPNSKDVFA